MNPEKSNRRDFLKKSSFAFLATGLPCRSGITQRSDEKMPPDLPKIKEYRVLGRTGAKVSDIGSGVPYSEGVLKAVLESGVNFIETAESYSNGRNEILIGNVVKKYEREKIFIATKASPGYKIFNSADDIIRRAEESLKRLQTNYIDLYMIHQAQNRINVKNEYFHKACEILKKNGKIRHVGLSCHGHSWWEEPGESLEDILMTAIEDGRFDVIFCPYNFFQPEMGERILKACKANNIGTMIMKANPMVSYDDYEKILKRGEELGYNEQKDYDKLKSWMENSRRFFEKYNMTDIEQLKEGAIQFILTNENVSTICCRFRTYTDIEKYVGLSGTTLNNRKSKLIAELRRSLGFLNCRIGCNICEQACPHRIPVNTIMRYNYYFQSLKLEKEAMQYYQELKYSRADICKSCDGHCEQACPYGVATRILLAAAHKNLSFGNI
jgi:predicted aldo/keto reductase-like oxidoreductase